MSDRPRWLTLGEDLLGPVVQVALTTTRNLSFGNPQVEPLAHMAACHFVGCLETSIEVNKQGRHSVAICLIRQCLEALAVLEVGLQDEAYATPLLLDWSEGRKSSGLLRKNLEQNVWAGYGNGLWDETWSEYFGNLAQAVHPYAHYSAELQGWQWAVVIQRETGAVMTIGMDTYDELKAARITLLHVLLGWTAARILLAHGDNEIALQHRRQVNELGVAIASSGLLFQKEDWGVQLIPHIVFKPGHDWRESA